MVQRKPLGRSPTPKQRKAVQLMSENVSADKPRSLKSILKEAGYSDNMSKRPSKVIEGDGFQRVLEEAGITDDILAETLSDGLRAVTFVKTEKVTGAGKSRIKTEDVVLVPDINTRHKYLETGLRLKGYGKQAGDININFNGHAQEQRKVYDV